MRYLLYLSTPLKFVHIILILLIFTMSASAQEVISLYGGAISGAKPTPADYIEESIVGNDGVLRVSKVSKPELHVYRPSNPTGSAVIICPGGGYALLAFEKEGIAVAKRFQQMGITAFVLKYRLPSDLIMKDKSLAPLQDALQAIYLVKKNAGAFGVNADKVGIMGFSAGGHLAATVNSHFADLKIENQENISLRPSFSILVYPVITFGNYAHAGSVARLLGDMPSSEQIKYFSNERQVSNQTPPTFLIHANDDKTVPVQNSLRYNEALVKSGVPVEMHVYQQGGHGFGLNTERPKDDWFERLKNWMVNNKLN